MKDEIVIPYIHTDLLFHLRQFNKFNNCKSFQLQANIIIRLLDTSMPRIVCIHATIIYEHIEKNSRNENN